MAENPIELGGSLMVFINTGGTGSTLFALAHASSAKFSMTTDTRERSDKDSADWKRNIKGKKGWTMSSDAFVNYSTTGVTGTTAYNQLLRMWLTDTPVYLSFAKSTGTSPEWEIDEDSLILSGWAIISGIDETADDNADATYSVSFLGDDALAISE